MLTNTKTKEKNKITNKYKHKKTITMMTVNTPKNHNDHDSY